MKTLLLALAGLTLLCPSAFARKQYAIKEGKPCAYCHVNPMGGGARNARGIYYATHKYSFTGYDEAVVMGRTLLFHTAVRESLPASVRKIGVADTAGDGVTRLVLLSDGSSANSSTLAIRKWDGEAKEWKTEFTTELPGPASRLAVGKFAGGAAAVIVTPAGLVAREGGAYKLRPAAQPITILGSAVLKNGDERLILKLGDSIKLFAVDQSKGADWLGRGFDPPGSSDIAFTDLKGSTEELVGLGMPNLLAQGGVVGLWDAGRKAPFLYGVQLVALVESTRGADEPDGPKRDPFFDKPDASGIVLKGREVYMTVVDPTVATMKTLWHSEKLFGSVLDATLNDPRNGGKGITVLSDSSEDGKGHTLYFFQLD